MNCRIPSTSLKSFVKAITCLCKIGDSINFEISPNRFVLRTLGPAAAAYFQINLATAVGVFFEQYNCFYQADINAHSNHNHNSHADGQSVSTLTTESARTIKARIKSKAFLSTLRITESAKYIDLRFDTDLHRVHTIIGLSYGIKRKYTIHFEDIDTILQADFDTNPNNIHLKEIHCSHHTFKRVLANFTNSLQEITLILTEQELAIKSFIDVAESTATPYDQIQTECHLKKDTDFTKFDIVLPPQQKQIVLTVVQKEFKAFLNLCDSLEKQIKIYLTFGGQPICMANIQAPLDPNSNHHDNNSNGIAVKLIMATISDDDQQIEVQQPNAPDLNASTTASQHSNRSNASNRASNSFSQSAAMNVRRQRREEMLQQQQQQHEHKLEEERHSTPLAQIPSSGSRQFSVHSDKSNVSRISAAFPRVDDGVDVDDEDVIIGLPTHGGFAHTPSQHDHVLDYLPNQTINTTQMMTAFHDETEHEEHDHRSQHERNHNVNVHENQQGDSRQRSASEKYSRLQPHPDSLDPPPKGQRLSPPDHRPLVGGNQHGNGQQANFVVNPPEIGVNVMDRTERNKRILPTSSSESARRNQARMNMNVNGHEKENVYVDSLELQYSPTDNTRNHANRMDVASDYLSSLLDYNEFENRAHSLTQTQPVDGGGISGRHRRQQQSHHQQVNRNRNHGYEYEHNEPQVVEDGHRKRRMQQDHYRNNAPSPKRTRYAQQQRQNEEDMNMDGNYHSTFTSTLRKKPKRPWQDSPR